MKEIITIMATKSGYDTETILKNMKSGMTIAQVIENVAKEQSRVEVTAEKFGWSIVVAVLLNGLIVFVSFLAFAPLPVLGLLGALFTVISWQQFGMLVGVGIIGFIANRLGVKMDKRLSPYANAFLKLKQARKDAAKAQQAEEV